MKTIDIALALAAGAAALAAPARAAPPAFPHRGRAGVVDAAHALTDAQRDALNRKVVAWDNATGHQLVVATVPNLQGVDVKEYGYQLGRAWGLGDKQRNDGVILLLAIAEHKVRIEVGYGLEPVLTDALTSEILSERVVPRLREGDISMALSDGADAIMDAATPAPSAPARAVARSAGQHGASLGTVIAVLVSLFGAAAAAISVWAICARRAAVRAYELRRRQESDRRREISRELSRPINATYFQANPSIPPAAPVRRSVDQSAAVAAASTYSPTLTSYSPSSSDDSSSSSSSSSSSDSSSSSSGFDSGGGSFGGGGSDSSW